MTKRELVQTTPPNSTVEKRVAKFARSATEAFDVVLRRRWSERGPDEISGEETLGLISTVCEILADMSHQGDEWFKEAAHKGWIRGFAKCDNRPNVEQMRELLDGALDGLELMAEDLEEWRSEENILWCLSSSLRRHQGGRGVPYSLVGKYSRQLYKVRAALGKSSISPADNLLLSRLAVYGTGTEANRRATL